MSTPVRNALAAVESWPVANCAAGFIDDTGTPIIIGDRAHRFAVASLTKPIIAWAVLVAVEEDIIGLDDDVGGAQPGCTLRHLLAHAGGYPFDADPVDADPVDADPAVAPPGTDRIYSNIGFEIAAQAVERASGIDIATYLSEAVLEPLEMTSTTLLGSPASGLWTTLGDLIAFLAEVISPRLISATTATDALRPQWPDLGGIVPGVGRFEPCPWGLGFEIAGDKHPHWMGHYRSPSTAGHFGAAGSMMWIDPDRSAGLAVLTDRAFGTWAARAVRAWSQISNDVIDAIDPTVNPDADIASGPIGPSTGIGTPDR